jgi:uncharacterized protein
MLHDADEGLLGFDPISPLKPFLGPGYAALATRLQTAIAQRYALEKWGAQDRRAHKQADRIAAASEALHVVGWSSDEVRHVLRIAERPVDTDPLTGWFDAPAWEPWDATLAAERFLRVLHSLSHDGQSDGGGVR